MNKLNPSVSGYIRKSTNWQEELLKLRAIVLDSPLTEEVKWRVPCYTLDGANVIIISRFKEYAALSFFKGALMKDPHGLIQAPGEETQSGRLIKFTSLQQIVDLEPVLRAYVQEAIDIEKAGFKVEYKKVADRPIPEELQARFDADPTLKTAFEALTPGRQRYYLLHFSSAKQSATRESRIEKCIPRIFEGKGLNDD